MVARYKAVQALINNNICSLPITTHTIEQILIDKGWTIITYDLQNNSHVELTKKIGVYDISKKEKAFTYYNTDGKKIVFIRSGLSNNNRRLLLAHELGHIELSHLSESAVLGYKPFGLIDDEQEDEANEFAIEFLAPVCILRKKRITNIKAISSITLLDYKRSRLVADEVIRHKKYTDYEIELCNQFCANETKKEKNIKIRYTVIAIITAIILVTSYMINMNVNKSNNTEHTINNSTAQTQVIQEATAAPVIAGVDVVVTKSGQKYHEPGCNYRKDKANLIHMTLKEAIGAGYEPCEICNPDKK